MTAPLQAMTGDTHSERMLVACISVAIQTMREMEPDPRLRNALAQRVAAVITENVS